jgi:hypothetical protein
MNFDQAGVVGREFEKRVTLPADRKDDPVVLELGDGAIDFVARRVDAGEAFMDFAGREEPAPALPQEIFDRFV